MFFLTLFELQMSIGGSSNNLIFRRIERAKVYFIRWIFLDGTNNTRKTRSPPGGGCSNLDYRSSSSLPGGKHVCTGQAGERNTFPFIKVWYILVRKVDLKSWPIIALVRGREEVNHDLCALPLSARYSRLLPTVRGFIIPLWHAQTASTTSRTSLKSTTAIGM